MTKSRFMYRPQIGGVVVTFRNQKAHDGCGQPPGHPQHLIDGQIVRDKHNHAVVKHHGRDGDELELVGDEGDFSAFALVHSICMGFATAFAIWYPPFKYIYSALAPSIVTGSVEWQTSSQAS